ncbi:MAG: deoxyguanosinetriphosphate triphosphohydrolase [Oscillospiraceae bacterium]|nr:deoxyguanosinetriphosphate triphosphohydrolase [Oscillospiraceae bacterium]
MSIREQLEINEKRILSKRACLSTDTGATIRLRREEPCPYRTAFQRDRDRILHCNAFRRLKRKTQVFLSPVGDHYRTRLTHTLEVSQVARTIARALFLNEDLTEAIALGHDVGHSPFGHAGESVLNHICPHGYRHYQQSMRVVDSIEKNGRGLNLTQAVRNGIVCHTNMIADTLEGNIVRVADRIAYINHDIEDAIRAGILTADDLPREAVEILGYSHTERITTLVAAVIAHGTDTIGMAPEIQQAHDLLHSFMYENVYHNLNAKAEEQKAKILIEELYRYFRQHPEKMPELYRKIAQDEDVDRAVCDYISGMSDGYAVDLYSELFIPRFWK